MRTKLHDTAQKTPRDPEKKNLKPFSSSQWQGDTVYKLLGWLNVDNIQGQAESCSGKEGTVMDKTFCVKGSAKSSVSKNLFPTAFSSSHLFPYTVV